jgi:hypothetical protein
MDTRELNFILKLLGCPNYRASIADVKPSIRTKSGDRDSICRRLCDRGLLDCEEEIVLLKIAPPGKALLKLNTTNLPISKAELKVLHACAESSIAPSDTGLKPEERQGAMRSLVERGLAVAEKTRIADVWITERGLAYLHDEYAPSGAALAISLDLLTNYLRFLRKSFSHSPAPATTPTPQLSTLTDKPSLDEILQLIADLDRQLGTDNYLPIYHLRQQLQPPMSREELDRSLYQLQRDDKIELSSLQEAIHYTSEQIESGIPQQIGGPLFFIIRN